MINAVPSNPKKIINKICWGEAVVPREKVNNLNQQINKVIE